VGEAEAASAGEIITSILVAFEVANARLRVHQQVVLQGDGWDQTTLVTLASALRLVCCFVSIKRAWLTRWRSRAVIPEW